MLKKLTHKNIIEVKAFLSHHDALILELCGINHEGADIIDVKDWSQNLVEKSAKTDMNVFQQILSGLSYLHSQDVLHCDLKPANCLVKGDLYFPVVKLADFGIAYFETVTQTETQISQVCIHIYTVTPVIGSTTGGLVFVRGVKKQKSLKSHRFCSFSHQYTCCKAACKKSGSYMVTCYCRK